MEIIQVIPPRRANITIRLCSIRGLPAYLGLEPVINIAFAVVLSHPYGVADGFGARTPMADYRDPLNADKRSATILGIVEPLLEPLESGPGEHCARLGLKRCFELLFEQPHHRLYYSLANFEGDITCKSITDDYIGLPRVHIAALDIPDEIEARVLQ